MAARAVDALRRGWTVRIGGLDLMASELADPGRLAAFSGGAAADLLISWERAVVLKLANQRAAAGAGCGTGAGAVRLAGAVRDPRDALALADPSLDLATPLKGPFRAVATGDDPAAAAAVVLARHAGLLPALLVRAAAGAVDAAAQPGDIAALLDPRRLEIATRARLPVAVAPDSEIVAFRSPEEVSDHVALVIGRSNGAPPLVRLHSECLTGDVLGSLKCDCGPQLASALHQMGHAGWGILLYLRQEGRGIGLVNKLRAYALQDQGFDTVDANIRLGFPQEARDFGIAAQMLHLLGQTRVRLLTNNPEKVAELTRLGIDVVERIGLALPANPHNAAYLATKRDRTGHQL